MIDGPIQLDAGGDTYDGRKGAVQSNIIFGDSNDTLYGGAGSEKAFAGADDDWLDGGLGDDWLDGEDGFDTAAFSGSIGAKVDLNLDGQQQNTRYGLDTLISIENLSGGFGDDDFTGDKNPNALFGGAGNDTLDGGLENDTLDGGTGTDTVVFRGMAGAKVNLSITIEQDTIGYGKDTFASIENLIGGAGDDDFTGSSGSNVLDGGMGNDTLDGGGGIDMALFSGVVGAKVSLAIATGQETGYGKDILKGVENLTGGEGADQFTGDGSANTLICNAGRDTLAGGLGNDTLAGGAGADFFVFDTKLSGTSNLDMITDFRRVDDTIRLENAIFKKLTKTGLLNKNNLAFGAKAKDKNDYLVYDKAKGALYYDADGSGKGAAVKFAQLVKNTALDYKDFIII